MNVKILDVAHCRILEKTTEKNNLQCHPGILYWLKFIANEFQLFYFQYVLLKSSWIINVDEDPNILISMLKVFSMFFIMLDYSHNQT